MKTELTEKDWMKIGNQSKFVRKELFKLICMSSGNMPVSIVDELKSSVAYLDRYKSKAEDRMMQSGISDRLDIFYGEQINDPSYETVKEILNTFPNNLTHVEQQVYALYFVNKFDKVRTSKTIGISLEEIDKHILSIIEGVYGVE